LVGEGDLVMAKSYNNRSLVGCLVCQRDLINLF